jgi:pyruvate/2-oxoglutarate dehydrogenase complex dihydrolipoamide dehydrogenase (E3) component
VIGAADTGCQLTSILADFGCEVTPVEFAPRIVQRADADISAALEFAFKGRGIEVITSAAVQQFEALQQASGRPDGGEPTSIRPLPQVWSSLSSTPSDLA